MLGVRYVSALEQVRIGCQHPKKHHDGDQVMCAWCWKEAAVIVQNKLKELEHRVINLETRLFGGKQP